MPLPRACSLILALLSAAAPLAAETQSEYDQRQRDKQYEATRDAIARPNAPNDPMTGGQNPLPYEEVERISREKEAAARERAQRAEDDARRNDQERRERAAEEHHAEVVEAARGQLDSEQIHREMSQIDIRGYLQEEGRFKQAMQTVDTEDRSSPAWKEAVQIISQWSDRGDAEASAKLGNLLVHGLVIDHRGEGRQLMAQGIRGGCSPVYMLLYAEALEGGFGGPVDLIGARCWYRAMVACRSPDAARACHVLGRMDEHGQGASVDLASAVRWYREASTLGNEFSRLRLAEMQRDGIGMPADPAAARAEFLQLAGSSDAAVARAAKAEL